MTESQLVVNRIDSNWPIAAPWISIRGLSADCSNNATEKEIKDNNV